MIINGNWAYYYANGLSATGGTSGNGATYSMTLTIRQISGGGTYYEIPLQGPGEGVGGFWADLVIINNTSTTRYDYAFSGMRAGKSVKLINANDNNNNARIYTNGVARDLYGGMAMDMIYLSTRMTPASPGTIGAGWMIVGSFDNNW